MNLNKLFLDYCNDRNLEININQKNIIKLIDKFYQLNFKNLSIFNIFTKKSKKLGFYLQGGVGVGKTMILNFFYENFNKSKQRLHFNEFMIRFHDFKFHNKENRNSNIIDIFVNKLKKNYQLIYIDEFQVTNIVDAMILGNLFEKIFEANIKVIFSSNIKINNLYQDGLQRDQFLPFIKVMKKMCDEETLVIKEDYRKSKKNKNERYFTPLNQTTNFMINKTFRLFTKQKNKKEIILLTKGRKFKIKNYYEGVARFDFEELCNKNVGAEDYIKVCEKCNIMVIVNIPNFNDNNSNQQQRFITLIDIIYEKKVQLIASGASNISDLSSSHKLLEPFKRTLSRLHELTSKNFTKN
jgi:cell division protein ZapE